MPIDALDFRQMGEMAYATLRDAIVKGELEPGSRLSQDDRARRLGVSRAPVRDALNRLEAEGLVRTTNRKGAAVVAKMTPQELLDIFEVRALVDSYAARKACEKMTAEDLLRLERNVEATAALSETGHIDDLVQAHTDFHHIIYSACGNAELGRIARNLWDRSYRYRVAGLSDKQFARSSLEDHRLILKSFVDRDCRRAEELMAQHNRNTSRGVLDRIRLASGADEPTGGQWNPPTQASDSLAARPSRPS